MTFPTHKTIDLGQSDIAALKKELKDFVLAGIEIEDSLFSLLKDDSAFYQRPEPLRHPLIFYYGHPFVFYVNKFYAAGLIKERLNAHMESILAIGVDEMSWDDLHEDHYDWPSVSDLRHYRQQVKELVLKLIDDTEVSAPVDWKSPLWPIVMGAEHHRIHLETSSVLIRQLNLKYINESERWRPCQQSGPAPLNELLPVEGGEILLGKKFDSPLYGWDNEYGQEEVHLKSFRASKFLVSNGEFLEFVKTRGYQQKEFWNDEGRRWQQYTKAAHPHFWREHQGTFHLRVIDREIALPLDWPVEINYLEAHAFCAWKSQQLKADLRLPTEAEWYALVQQSAVPAVRSWQKAPGNINLEHYPSPAPVNLFAFDNFFDVIGNVWQWTETAIYPFEGFKVHELYDDFSVPTFDGKHNLIKGGSFISTGNEASIQARYAFRRHFFQHAGFRYVEATNPVKTFNNTYETDTQLSQYCEFHYGDQYFDVPNFPKTCIEVASRYFHLLPANKRALDLGCAVGRSTFELARSFDHVTGIDYSARFIDKALQVQELQSLRYVLTSEGDLVDFYERDLKELELVNLKGEIEFMQGDACNLASKYSHYDLIFAGNLIDRLRSPRTFLQNIHKHMNSEGLLVVCSPYTWLEEFTPKEEWLGGYKKDGENVTTLQGLKESLSEHFELVASEIKIPFVIRETKHKFQHSISEMSVWKRKK